ANPHISFAKIVDQDGDSATFLNLLLPNTDAAQRVVAELNKNNIGGFNYWFTNMYHFINQWEHLKNMQTASRLVVQMETPSQDYKTLQLPKSQEVVGRLISFGIRCTWTEEEVTALAAKINECVTLALTTRPA